MPIGAVVLLFVFTGPLLYRLSVDSLIYYSAYSNLDLQEAKHFVESKGFLVRNLYKIALNSSYFQRNLSPEKLQMLNIRRLMASVIPVVFVILLLVFAFVLLRKNALSDSFSVLLPCILLAVLYLKSYRFGSGLLTNQ